ncbi:MAG: gliding motility lipoprotein GldB [Bacteroidota bacterium]
MKLICKYFPIVLLAFVISCNEEDNKEKEIAAIPVDLKVERFDRQFASAGPGEIPKLKAQFPYLFPEQFSDSVWLAKLNDTIQQELFQEVDKVFGGFTKEETELTALFQHIKYYFPGYTVPQVVTLTSEVQYNNRIVLTDSILLIGLDNYLGKNHHFYRGIARYITKGLDKQFLVSDVANAFAKRVNTYPRNRTFLSRMVYYGKELYLKDKVLPNSTDARKIGYEPEEWAWAQANEQQMWRYIVEQELLYSTDAELDRRFLDPAPFSKFQLELDSESPGRLGRYMGWQIVRAFMTKNPEVSLLELLELPADEIFKNANYKPKK